MPTWYDNYIACLIVTRLRLTFQVTLLPNQHNLVSKFQFEAIICMLSIEFPKNMARLSSGFPLCAQQTGHYVLLIQNSRISAHLSAASNSNKVLVVSTVPGPSAVETLERIEWTQVCQHECQRPSTPARPRPPRAISQADEQEQRGQPHAH
jgi:hypothetical protein